VIVKATIGFDKLRERKAFGLCDVKVIFSERWRDMHNARALGSVNKLSEHDGWLPVAK
jgi:hypothetical protein